jgi:hypothetical protein
VLAGIVFSVLTGGASRDRTGDLLLAKQALSQLSYGPVRSARVWPADKLVGLGRLELPTSPLSGVRSNHLSYRPSRALLMTHTPGPTGDGVFYRASNLCGCSRDAFRSIL